ncbi:MAG: CoA-binding protein [Calditrichaeota bacterium]|nr:CoA-binding protein [Calditrichota bacterium]
MLKRDPSMDQQIVKILTAYRNVAIVGASNKPHRDSFQVTQFLMEQGFQIFPVNPNVEEILGRKCYPSLMDIPETVEIVDIFRRPEEVVPIVEQAIAIGAKVIWMQLGVINEEAARLARKSGLSVIMNRCIKIEFQRWMSDTEYPKDR